MGWDSLVISNTVELLGGGVASSNPLCSGARFMLQPGADPGAPQPTTQFVASLLLDGERPFGRRASNRTIKLPVWITAPDRATLAAAREVLEQAVDQDYFTIVWTRDPSSGNPGSAAQPAVFDCFRAEPTVAVFNTLWEKEICGLQVQLTIPALPYARSATQAQVSFAAPVPTSPAVAPPPSPVVLDDFSTISSGQCTQSSRCVIGPTSCLWDPDSFGDPGGQQTALTYGASFSSALDLTGMTSLQMWLGLGSRYYANLEYVGKCHGVSAFFTLTDSSGGTLSFSRSHLLLPVAPDTQSPVFTRITAAIPQDSAAFDYSSVASYSMTVANRQGQVITLSWVTAYIDALTAYPGSEQVTPVTRGAVYTLYGVQGTARAPVSMSFQQPPAVGTATTLTAAGSGTYTVPAGTSWLKVECTGAGGAGATVTAAGVGAGGGGGGYGAEAVFPASPGMSIPYIVGTAGTPGTDGLASVFGPAPGSTLQVTGNGGKSASGNTAGAGGAASANSAAYAGGAGRANPAGTYGGGGGSSAGTSSAGGTPIGTGSVLFTAAGTYSGSGSGWLCPDGVTQVLAEVWGPGGGGGSGGTSSCDNGAGGGGGGYRSALIGVTPGTYYTVVVGAGGAGGTSGGNGAAGGSSSFTGDAGAQVLANGGGGGKGNTSASSGTGGAGGTGGTGTTSWWGGTGGGAYPYTGGGGSSAGPAAIGNTGGKPSGAIAPAGGGNGGSGSGSAAGAGQAGQAPGGGGGGAHESSYAGGAGAAGQVRITYPTTAGAPTPSGANAVTGGGAGGAGASAADTGGTAGASPGGGGGGAWMSTASQSGGDGADGQVKITPYIPAAFKSLIVHRPPAGASKTFQPLVSVGEGGDEPNGTYEYVMPQPVTGVNADFGGTYTVYLVASSWSGTGSRTVYVTVTQYEAAGGAGYTRSTLPVTFTPSQVTNGILRAGVITLPVKAVAPDNLDGYYTVRVTDSNISDRYLDCIFLDTMGQTVVVNEPASGYVTYYIDAPDPNVNLGRIMGSQGGRGEAIGVFDACTLSGPSLHVEPADGDNLLFVYCADASVPNVSLSYFPCFYFDRVWQ